MKVFQRICRFCGAVVFVAALCCTASLPKALAQDPSAKAKAKVHAVVTEKAPKFIQSLKARLAEKIESKAEFFANQSGALSVHQALSPQKLHELALWLGRQKGVRLAFHDKPRRMILLVFESAKLGITPAALAAPLEKMRQTYLQEQTRQKKQRRLGTAPKIQPPSEHQKADETDKTKKPKHSDKKPKKAGDHKIDQDGGGPSKTDQGKKRKKGNPEPKHIPKSPKDLKSHDADKKKQPKEPKPSPGKAQRHGPKKRNSRKQNNAKKLPTAIDSFRPYSLCEPKLTEADVEAVQIFGEITGRAALKLWFQKKNRGRAVAVARKALKRNKLDFDAGVVTALFSLQNGNKLKAYQNLRTVVHKRPDVGLYHDIYAEVLDALKMSEKAKEARAKAADLGIERDLKTLGLLD